MLHLHLCTCPVVWHLVTDLSPRQCSFPVVQASPPRHAVMKAMVATALMVCLLSAIGEAAGGEGEAAPHGKRLLRLDSSSAQLLGQRALPASGLYSAARMQAPP